ncbi:MAG TPA: insulinase family protein [Longimicrobiales bacterium]|jgi:zinc protease
MIPSRLRACLCASAAVVLVSVPADADAQIPMDALLPVDPAVTVGELDNGLRYFIRRNGRPENRAELRLVVNAGSVLEDDSQRGLAHLVEHMAFNGTEHFEKQELVDYLESIGMEFGPSINAYTSFDETVYMLHVPTDDPEVVGTAFQILEDWAHLVSFEPEEIDKERGVVVEEWRLGRGASARILDQQLPIMFQGSRYAERLPIGDVETLQTFPHEELTRFYETWYRPDLMAVVAVGDFEPRDVEELVRTHFGRIPARAERLDRPYHDVPDHAETYYAIASDPEATGSQIAVLTMQEPRDVTTVGEYRQSLVEGLASGMMNDRFRELIQQADPPFVAAGTGRGRFVRTKSAFQLAAFVPEGGHLRALEALVEEAERAARHGFTAGEMERQKLDVLRGLERVYADRDNQPSARFASEYVSHFLQGEAIPGIEFEYQASQVLMGNITLDEVNAVARENLDDANRVVLVDGPRKPDLELPDRAGIEGVFAAVEGADIEPWVDTALDQPLVAELPTPGSVVEESSIPELNVTLWTLSNGVTVWLKPTDFKEDEIVMQATSPGGWSNSSLEDHASATLAAVLVRQGGAGDFSLIDLQKALAGKSVTVAPGIGETTEGMSGQASPKDLETLFQLVWLYFTAPREDSTAFQSTLAQNRAFLENRSASPSAAFSDTFSVTMSQGHPRSRPPSVETLDELDLGRAIDFYQDRFADAGDFTFVFVGSLDLEAMRPLVERYLGALPTVEREDGWVDLDIDPPQGRIEKTVRRGIEPQSATVVAFTGPFDYTAQNRVGMRAMAQALEIRLRERMREDLGGTYSVSVNGAYDDVPEERYTVTIQFGSDPERTDELRAVVFEEIGRLAAEGPSQEDVIKVVEAERRSLETNLQQNGWWAVQLRFSVDSGTDPRFLIDTSRFDAITIESIRADAQRYLNEDRVVVVTLLPQGVGAP